MWAFIALLADLLGHHVVRIGSDSVCTAHVIVYSKKQVRTRRSRQFCTRSANSRSPASSVSVSAW